MNAFVVSTLVFALSANILPLAAADPAPRKPNIILILADDMGYADLGIQGCRDIPTPHIDSIAKNGARFTEAYVPGPHCVPSRMALMTGRYPARFIHLEAGGMGAGTENGLSLEESTLADALHADGYTCAAFGKWHLGELEKFHPLNRGFDEFYGFLAGMHDYFKDADKAWGPIMDGRKPGKLNGYLTDVLGDHAVEFIQRRQKTGQPWFVYLAFNAVHTPQQAREDKLQAFAGISDPTRQKYAAKVSSLDDAVGRVLEAVRDSGAEKDTLIFFMSDNGGPLPGHAGANGALNTPLRGSKLEVWEGGVRVPLFAQWPGHIPAGETVPGMVSSMDITATALAAAGATPSKPLDGLDLLPLLEGRGDARRHDALFFEFASQEAVRVGDWKWVNIPRRGPGNSIDSGSGLFNLKNDIAEKNDLAAENPEKAKELQDKMTAWRREVGAGFPKPETGVDKAKVE